VARFVTFGGLCYLWSACIDCSMSRPEPDPTQALVVIVHDNDRRCCLLVDELLGQQQVVIKSLGDSIGKVPGVSAARSWGRKCQFDPRRPGISTSLAAVRTRLRNSNPEGADS